MENGKLSIGRDPSRGRFASCLSPVVAGTLLYTSSPFVSSSLTCCMICKTKKKARKCTLCKTVVYCSVKCQRTDWSMHKIECPALQKAFSSKYRVTETAILALRFILKNQNNETAPRWYSELAHDYPKGWKGMKLENIQHMAKVVLRLASIANPSEEWSLLDVCLLLAKFAHNVFTIVSSVGEVRGIGTLQLYFLIPISKQQIEEAHYF